MTVARSAGEVLAEHTTLELECIDRMYLNVYVPLLQSGAGAAYFFRKVRGNPVPSSALMEPMTRRFVAAIERYAAKEGVELIRFERFERKDDRTQQYLRDFTATEGVLYIGKAQEKARVLRTERRVDPVHGPYPWLVSSTAMVNHYYAYLVDEDFGPLFLKFCSYFPYNAKLCINGHEYLKRQLAKRGVAFEALDNGVLSCAGNPKATRSFTPTASPAPGSRGHSCTTRRAKLASGSSPPIVLALAGRPTFPTEGCSITGSRRS